MVGRKLIYFPSLPKHIKEGRGGVTWVGGLGGGDRFQGYKITSTLIQGGLGRNDRPTSQHYILCLVIKGSFYP